MRPVHELYAMRRNILAKAHATAAMATLPTVVGRIEYVSFAKSLIPGRTSQALREVTGEHR